MNISEIPLEQLQQTFAGKVIEIEDKQGARLKRCTGADARNLHFDGDRIGIEGATIEGNTISHPAYSRIITIVSEDRIRIQQIFVGQAIRIADQAGERINLCVGADARHLIFKDGRRVAITHATLEGETLTDQTYNRTMTVVRVRHTFANVVSGDLVLIVDPPSDGMTPTLINGVVVEVTPKIITVEFIADQQRTLRFNAKTGQAETGTWFIIPKSWV